MPVSMNASLGVPVARWVWLADQAGNLLDEEDRSQQLEVAVQRGPRDAGCCRERGRNQQAAGAASQQGQQAAEIAAPLDHR